MQVETFKIAGMICDGCADKVTHALRAVAGVGDLQVSLASDEATVQFDERSTSLEQLKTAVREAGYRVDGVEAAAEPKAKRGCCCR